MRTLNIGGVKTRPKWKWSKAYESDVRQHARQMSLAFFGEYCGGPKDAAEFMAIRYARWIAKRDGLDLSECPRAECDWDGWSMKQGAFIYAVRFGVERRERRPVGKRSWRYVTEFHTALTVDIPNANPVAAHAWSEESAVA